MGSLVEQIASIDNLMLAWRKIENLFIPGDIWYDPLRLAAFKYRLKDNLEIIRKKLLEGTYSLQKIAPVPFPKKKKDGIETIRQSFIIDVSDQLVWVAVCNVIGVYLDSKMPAWSYGNRLYIYWWKDKEDKWQIGNYRNSTPVLYRNWNQSWPQMKRRITVSLKKMAFANGVELDEEEQAILEQEKQIKLSYAKLKYLNDNYFAAFNGKGTDTLYWVGLDLTKFYTKVKIDKVVEIIIRELGQRVDASFVALLNCLTAFEIDSRNYEHYEDGLEMMDLTLDAVSYDALPTGLLVAGFLANVYMLDIDREADKYLDKHHDVIHFRYVDDHVIIGRTEDALKCWVDKYLELLKKAGLDINKEKAEPSGVIKDELGKLSVDNEVLGQKGIIDAFYPTPLMTQTLQKVSMLSKERLPLLSSSEFNLVFKDLQTMLVTDIPETEIKKATRISFACTMLSRMMRTGHVDYHEVYRTRRDLYDSFMSRNRIKENDRQRLVSVLFRDEFFLAKKELEVLDERERSALRHLEDVIKDGNKKDEVLSKSIFNLLMRSLNEVPDKVKIWVRAFLFAVNHFPEGIKHICNKLRQVSGKSLHPLSVLYLESVIEFLCADSIIEIIKYLYINDYPTTQERDRDITALGLLLNISYEDEGFDFKKVSSLALRHAKALYQAHCADLGLEPFRGETLSEPLYSYEDGLPLDSTFWALWELENLDERRETATFVAKKLVHNIDYEVSSPYLEAFIFRLLSVVDVSDKESERTLPTFQDVDSFSTELRYALRMSEIGQKIYSTGRSSRLSKQSVNLFDWISSRNEALKRFSKKDDISYLRELNHVTYYEVFSVKLMIAIAEKAEEKLRMVDTWSNCCIHPQNIILDRKAIDDISWAKVLDDEPIRIKLLNREIEGADYYYTLRQTAPCELPVYYSVCYGLGLIFLHLLTRKRYFPWIMNNPNYGFEWRRELNEILNKGEVSSINFKIVEACLSMWNRETIYLNRTLGESLFRNDESNGTMSIRGIDDLIDALKESFKQMKSNVISVPENQYRQLVEITID